MTGDPLHCDKAPDGWWCSRDPGHDGPCAAHPAGLRRRMIVMPAYAVGLACLTVVALLVLTLVGSIEIADRNAADLLRRYEADKQATAEQNKAVTCALFSSQLDAFADAESDVGRKSYQAWLGVYRLARCSPDRN